MAKVIYVKYKPTEKQKLFHSCPADEALYGGAAGGGKSVALVMDALYYGLKYPGSNIILFRRTYPELEASLIENALKFYPPELYSYNQGQRVMKLVNGSKILFRYMEHKKDATRYQGAEFQYIGFDELTHFSRQQYEFLKSRLRSSKRQPKYIRTTANPDPYHPQNNEWVKFYFVKFAEPLKIKKDEHGKTRAFIPANVYDNPHLIENDPDYVKRLESLPELEKQAFLHGNWDIQLEGVIYNNFSYEKHVQEFEVDPRWTIIAGIDFGATNPTAVAFIATDGDRFFVFDEIYTPDILVNDLAKEIKLRKPRLVYADPSGKGTIKELKSRGINIYPGENDVLAGIMKIRQVIQDNKLIVHPRCENFLEEIFKYVWEKEKEKPMKAFDHLMDAMRYAIYTFSQRRKPAPTYKTSGVKRQSWRG